VRLYGRDSRIWIVQVQRPRDTVAVEGSSPGEGNVGLVHENDLMAR
jgi:hypothetical protein